MLKILKSVILNIINFNVFYGYATTLQVTVSGHLNIN
mgnify:CR=1 FL=1